MAHDDRIDGEIRRSVFPISCAPRSCTRPQTPAQFGVRLSAKRLRFSRSLPKSQMAQRYPQRTIWRTDTDHPARQPRAHPLHVGAS